MTKIEIETIRNALGGAMDVIDAVTQTIGVGLYGIDKTVAQTYNAMNRTWLYLNDLSKEEQK